jgi:hypothetical protein
MAKDNVVSQTENMRSAFSLDILEIVVATVAALVTWFGMRSFLHSLLPLPCGDAIDCGWTEEQAWQTLGLPLFSKFIIPLLLFNALAGVFLVRAIRRDVREFSVMGSLALVWPLISMLGIHFLFYIGMCVLPIGFALSIPATILSVEEKRDRLDWISLPLSFVSMVVCGMYLSELWRLYGD